MARQRGGAVPRSSDSYTPITIPEIVLQRAIVAWRPTDMDSGPVYPQARGVIGAAGIVVCSAADADLVPSAVTGGV